MLLSAFSATYTYSNCIVYRYSIAKNNLTNICSKISKIGMNIWMITIKYHKFLDKSIYFWLPFESYCFHGHA